MTIERRKKPESEQRIIFNIKMTPAEINDMKALAKRFAKGNCSAWARHAILKHRIKDGDKAVVTELPRQAPVKAKTVTKKPATKVAKKVVATKSVKTVKPAKVKTKAVVKPMMSKKSVKTTAPKKVIAKSSKKGYSFT